MTIDIFKVENHNLDSLVIVISTITLDYVGKFLCIHIYNYTNGRQIVRKMCFKYLGRLISSLSNFALWKIYQRSDGRFYVHCVYYQVTILRRERKRLKRKGKLNMGHNSCIYCEEKELVSLLELTNN